MIREIAIDTGALRKDIESMSGELGNIRQEISGMYDAMEELNRMWEGPANQVFMQQFKDDYENMQYLWETIRKLLDYMMAAAGEYESGDNRVNDIVASIRI